MPDGTTREWRRSTESLTAEDKEHFIQQIEADAAMELGLDMTYERRAA